MRVDQLTVDFCRLWGGESFADWPCVFIEGGESSFPSERIVLPPCPVVQIGDSFSSLASHVDAVVSDNAAAEKLVAAIGAQSRAAEVVVGLLRCLPALSLEQGLIAESLAYGVLQAGADHAAWLAARKAELASAPGLVRTRRDGESLSVMLDRPWADNAIDRPMRDGLAQALELAVLDPAIRRVSLRGSGRSFSLGADLSEFGTTRDPAEAHYIRQRTLPARWAARCSNKLEAHIHGACVGSGLELVAFAGRITASSRAWFQLPELAMGILPGAGGCVSLTRRIGRQRTARLILTGERISARVALDWGLIDAIVDDPAINDGSPHEA